MLFRSDETIAPFDDVPAEALRVKHPARASSDSMTPTPKSDSCLCLQQANVMVALKSFMPGSAGGLDGLRPPHLKDMTSVSAGDAGQRLQERGAALCALNKTVVSDLLLLAAHFVGWLRRQHARR